MFRNTLVIDRFLKKPFYGVIIYIIQCSIGYNLLFPGNAYLL